MRVAVDAPITRANALVAILASRGIEACPAVDCTAENVDAVIAVYEHGVVPATGAAASNVATVLAVDTIDHGAVALASALGVSDIVMLDDEARLVAAVERAKGSAPMAAGLSLEAEVEILRKAFDLTPNYVSIRDAAGRVIVASQSFADFYGTTVEELMGKPLDAYASPEEAAIDRVEDMNVLATRRSRVVERDMVDRSGARRRLSLIKRPLIVNDGRTTLVLYIGLDITRRYRTENAFEKTNDFLKNVLESISDAVFALDLSGKFTLANHRLVELTGYAHHTLLGSAFTKIFTPHALAEAKRNVAEAMSGAEHVRFEARVARADGDERIVSCSLMPLIRKGTLSGIVGTAEDVTERRLAEHRIEHLAYHDPLTGLPNRRLLHDRLHIALSQAERDDRLVAVLFLDLDRFKIINDSLGHRIGDMLLQELGVRLRDCVRPGDTVARLGGDEFVFLVPGLPDRDAAIRVAEKVLAAVRQPFVIDGRELTVTACVGMSFFPGNALEGEMLIRQADVALFQCKRKSRDAWCVYDSSMSMRSYERFELEHDLRRALRDGELTLHYQPIVDMRTGKIVMLEALVRWNHAARGMLMPELFVSLAEEIGVIEQLGAWVLREATRQNAAWQRSGMLTIPVAVNVSARQFDGPIYELVRDALADANLDPRYLALELTESILVQSAASPTRTIEELKGLGVELAIDDFGTGYSSLSYLERFPIDVIKIDRTFIPQDMSRPQAGLIANAVIALAQGLGLRSVAEGVETATQRDFLLARGCVLGQGHFYAKAMAPEDVERLVSGELGDRVLA